MEDQLTKREKRELAKEEKKKESEKRRFIHKLRKLFLVFIPVIAVVFLGYKSFKFIKEPTPETLSYSVEIVDSDWIRGRKEAKVTLLEYGDFQCPACATYYPIVRELKDAYPEDLKVVYRQFPLISIHKNAYSAARASEAAGRQDKFWEMHDTLYEKQADWENTSNPKEKFRGYAESLKLNLEQFDADYDSKEVEERINNNLASARSLSVNSTPTFFLDGQKVVVKSLDEFKGLVEDQVRGYSLE